MQDFEDQKKDPIGLTKDDLETLFESTFNKLNKNTESNPHLPPFLEAKNEVILDSEITEVKNNDLKAVNKTRSSLRIKYEAEAQVIKKSLGDIEDIRRGLGLSKRKMAQLLLVDPSAWTRWTKAEEEPPPHIYRALQWYMILQEKHPELRASVWLNNVAQPQISRHQIDSIKNTIFNEIGLKDSHNFLDLKRILTEKSEQSKNEIKSLKFKVLTLTIIYMISVITMIVYSVFN